MPRRASGLLITPHNSFTGTTIFKKKIRRLPLGHPLARKPGNLLCEELKSPLMKGEIPEKNEMGNQNIG